MTDLVSAHFSLKDKNWFKTGGAARFYAAPTTGHEFQQSLEFAQKNALPVFVLGEGANVLINDDGFDGLVICPALKSMAIGDTANNKVLVTTGAGASMQSVIDYCLANNITGLEEFSGIPGTIGGSVYINLHYFEFLLSQFLVSACVIDKQTLEIMTVDNAWFEFGYNQSKLIAGNHYLIDATFALKKATELETAYARGRRDEIIRHRKQRYPQSNTCGSFFRNFLPDEVTLEQNGKKIIYVAYYLDKVGIKGKLAHGGAIVSYQHANMIVSNATATTADIINLARTMQQKVYDEFGILPQPECRLIGFKTYPLLTLEDVR